jgi:hypothetical protein
MTTIVTLNAARARNTQQVLKSDAVVYWPVSELHQSDKDEWITNAVKGTPEEDFAQVMWAHHPNLKEATRKLAEYIGPRWPAKDGRSLLAVCIAEALRRSNNAVKNGESFLGRIVGVYLYGLTEHAADVARLSITGMDLEGITHRWTPFSEPLAAWAKRLRVDTVCVEFASPAPSEGTIAGIRTHMVTHLSNPTDTGYLLRHAAHG